MSYREYARASAIQMQWIEDITLPGLPATINDRQNSGDAEKMRCWYGDEIVQVLMSALSWMANKMRNTYNILILEWESNDK